jgi:hypothetical protein
MTTDSPQTVTRPAQALADTADPDGAPAPVQPSLDGLDPRTAPTDDALIDAAIRYATETDPNTSRRQDLAWARYAYAASRERHGWYHRRTVHAAGALADRLHVYDHDRQGHALRLFLVDAHRHLDGPAAYPTAMAAIDLAATDYRLGYCDSAMATLTWMWQAWQRHHGPGTETGHRILLHLAYLTASCGLRPENDDWWAQALAASPPPDTDDPDHLDTIPLHTAFIDPTHDHHCAHRPHPDVATPRRWLAHLTAHQAVTDSTPWKEQVHDPR